MTESELHLTMTSGFSTIAGSVLGAYIAMGMQVCLCFLLAYLMPFQVYPRET